MPLTLPTRKIGNSQVSAIGLGMMGLAFLYGAVGSKEERFKILDRAADSGCNFWDTSNVYADSEELLGAWFKRTGRRSDIFLATKFGYTPEYTVRGDAAFIKECAERSLKTLDVEYIDLYYAHRLSKDVPVEVTIRAMAELVKEGKVRYLGLCECSSDTLRRAHAVHPISVVQMEYSIMSLDIEDPKIGVLNTARELGVKIVCYSPLGRGTLSGNYTTADFTPGDFRLGLPRFNEENMPKTLALAKRLKEIGSRHNATAAQVALAWLLGQGEDIIPIPGTKKLKYLEQNLDAVKLVLSGPELAEVRQAAKEAGCGNIPRYQPFLLNEVFTDTPPLKE